MTAIFSGRPAVRALLVELSLKAQLLKDDPQELDRFIQQQEPQIVKAILSGSQLLNETQVAQRYGNIFSVKRLRNMRYRGTGPYFHKLGDHKNSRVFYKVSDLEHFIATAQQLTNFLPAMTVTATANSPHNKNGL
ncbi:helix-turn-helix transcriptional regulator [Acanthopleuribacter pedis]|uniref:Uncharacterized protein n=1 Tax=Acanthopleuribacter pedis TaxID=442870 RepID=A0A8J7U4Z5_9BACT|nr:hypothetical protein [Acanthopleuribacter pedis]MBO1321993.1 hypothetical protein [Acanthopleuribacter pedis]